MCRRKLYRNFFSPYLTEEYPIWHGQAPRIISTFLESYDFSGKTIVPFCTSHSSGIGSSASNLHALCPDSVKWAEGKRFGAGTSKEAMEEWLAENGLKKPVEGTCSHSYTEAVTKEPSCVETGERTYTCIHCGSSYTEATAAAGHTLAVDPAVPAGCKTQGKTEGSHCSVCGQIIKAQEDIPADGHKTQKEVKKAGRSSDGKVKEICTVCSTVVKEQTVASIKFIRLSKESYTYNGKARKPSVTVTDRQGRALSEGTDFTVSYPAGRKNTGIYTLKITFRGSYGGTAEKSFQIIPKRMAIAKLTPKKKGFSVNMIPSFLVLDGFMGEYGRAFPLGVR